MNLNDIKFSHTINGVGAMYAKVTGKPVIGELMAAAGAMEDEGTVDVQKLCPTNITLTNDNEQWNLSFNINDDEFNKLFNYDSWQLRIYSETIELDTVVDMDALSGGDVVYDNGLVTCNGVIVGTIGEDSYRASAKWTINGSDHVPFYSLPITVFNHVQ